MKDMLNKKWEADGWRHIHSGYEKRLKYRPRGYIHGSSNNSVFLHFIVVGQASGGGLNLA